jgi:hypothetical protein
MIALTRAPRQSSQGTDGLSRLTSLKQLVHKGLYQGGHTAVAIGPRDRRLFNRPVAVFQLGNWRTFALIKVSNWQVSRWRNCLSVQPLIWAFFLGSVGTAQTSPFFKTISTTTCCSDTVKVYLLDRPGGLQIKKMLIMCSVFHGDLDSLKKKYFTTS